MKLSILRKIIAAAPASLSNAGQAQRTEYLRGLGMESGDIYQELEMDSPYVDTHRDVTFAGSPVALHSHDFYELLYCCNTCGAEYLVGAERYRLQKGDIVLIPPELSHRPLLPEGMTAPYNRVVLWLSREFVRDVMVLLPEDSLTDAGNHVLLRTAGTPWSELEALFFEGVKISQSRSPEAQLLLIGNTLTLLAKLRSAFTHRQAGKIKAEKPELLDRLMAYIEENLSQKITLADTAGHFYISQSTVTQLFRKKLGVSFYRFVTQRRLIWAKALIQEGKPLEQIAEQVGFSDYSVFYRAFRQEYGISPRQFRKL